MSAQVYNILDGHKNREVLLNTIAKTLGTSKDDVLDAHIKVTSNIMAKTKDGYVLYSLDGVKRAALVVNMEYDGYKFPFLYHSDDGYSEPVGLLYDNIEFEYLGDFIGYVSRAENISLYHEIADYIPLELNGIGVIQGIELAKSEHVSSSNELGIRRIAKTCIQMLG